MLIVGADLGVSDLGLPVMPIASADPVVSCRALPVMFSLDACICVCLDACVKHGGRNEVAGGMVAWW